MIEIKEEFLLSHADAFILIKDIYPEVGLTKDQIDCIIVDSLMATSKGGDEIGKKIISIITRSFEKWVFKDLHRYGLNIDVNLPFLNKMRGVRNFAKKHPPLAHKIKCLIGGDIDTRILESILKNI